MTKPTLKPGDTVFIRWHGDAEFELIEQVDGCFPHWKCKSIDGDGDEVWIAPQIHLSRKSIQMLAGDHNYKQLAFV